MSGREKEVEFPLANPGDNAREGEDDVSIELSSCGFVVDVYCPGRSCIGVFAPEDEIVAPAGRFR